LLESCGIDPDLVADPEARVPADVFDRFWPRAAEVTGDPCFGLHVGEQLRPGAVNINGYLLMSSPTVREGLERVVAYQRVVFDADWITLVDRGGYALIRFEPSNVDPTEVAVQIEYKAMIVLKLLDWVTAADFKASEVRFRHRPAGPTSEYERILHCPVKFQQKESALVVSSARLDQPSIHANPEIARLHEEHAKRHLADLEDHSVTRRAKQILMGHLDRGPCELPELARSLHMSSRTLQRRLDEEKTSYKEVLDSLRREICLHHLQRPHTALAEVAHLVGFSDTSALSRAVRRWTGRTPIEYRRSHLDAAETTGTPA
jgi:AraC-like DNA-binding protein